MLDWTYKETLHSLFLSPSLKAFFFFFFSFLNGSIWCHCLIREALACSRRSSGSLDAAPLRMRPCNSVGFKKWPLYTTIGLDSLDLDENKNTSKQNPQWSITSPDVDSVLLSFDNLRHVYAMKNGCILRRCGRVKAPTYPELDLAAWKCRKV